MAHDWRNIIRQIEREMSPATMPKKPALDALEELATEISGMIDALRDELGDEADL